jgi:hypothetical protein
MRSITTDYNNSAYNSATKFTDVYSANGVTVPAKTPVNVRSMMDSVGAGDYVLSADTIAVDDATIAVAADATIASVITATISSVATAGIPIAVTSSDPTKATVSPALVRTKADGTATFTVTGVAAGSSTLTFKTYGATSVTAAVTVS